MPDIPFPTISFILHQPAALAATTRLNRQSSSQASLAGPITIADEIALITITYVVVVAEMVQEMRVMIMDGKDGSGNRVGSRCDCHGKDWSMNGRRRWKHNKGGDSPPAYQDSYVKDEDVDTYPAGDSSVTDNPEKTALLVKMYQKTEDHGYSSLTKLSQKFGLDNTWLSFVIAFEIVIFNRNRSCKSNANVLSPLALYSLRPSASPPFKMVFPHRPPSIFLAAF
ncbi:hypothetical protein GH714_001700 [Hevea brasiliensis]|uniref:Uncharacterized protein n=1 Tax=Hevea brasiliensis TaxID=3981 RepID=A0A6A6L829_HEVBR|nr:hypothetical protein GH714_001700 [Hevea brasiliensis]